jgi:hypothetical protein
VEIKKEGNLVESFETLTGLFENLLTNTMYEVVVTYVYDLNDGEGEQELTKSITVKTLEEKAPEVLVVTAIQNNTLNYQVAINDVKGLGRLDKVELFAGKNLITTSSNLIGSFNNLLNDTEYTVVVTYKYDLNDGLGEQLITSKETTTTKALTIPTLDLITSANETKIRYEAVLHDPDNVAVFSKVKIYQNGNLKETITDSSAYEVSGLIPNVPYEIEVEYIPTEDFRSPTEKMSEFLDKYVHTFHDNVYAYLAAYVMR